ncbi:hypothetical protein H0G86_008386 [Trichoderma simmonsii]|uniref:Uncharacterized protein n=1 Tax=Trichoderma simmonsii TaxID=1491479 RepID=A0A8G0PHA7_9HYPO|nr:hypothetical protein H0G86_008386 [Trichoderma simmonsii]
MDVSSTTNWRQLGEICHGEKALRSLVTVCLFRPKQRPGLGSTALRLSGALNAFPLCKLEMTVQLGTLRFCRPEDTDAGGVACKKEKEHTGAVLCCTIRRGTRERGWEDEDS